MSVFNIKIVTSDKQFFDGDVSMIVARTTQGDIGILANHIGLVAPLDVGRLELIFEDGARRIAALAGGFMRVAKNGTTIVARTCEWADEIDLDRAKRARDEAERRIEANHSDAKKMQLAEYKLKKAINRIDLAKK